MFRTHSLGVAGRPLLAMVLNHSKPQCPSLSAGGTGDVLLQSCLCAQDMPPSLEPWPAREGSHQALESLGKCHLRAVAQ